MKKSSCQNTLPSLECVPVAVVSYTISFLDFRDHVTAATLNAFFSSICTLRSSLPHRLHLVRTTAKCPARLVHSHVRDLLLPWSSDIDMSSFSDLPRLERVTLQWVPSSMPTGKQNGCLLADWMPPPSITHLTLPGVIPETLNPLLSRLPCLTGLTISELEYDMTTNWKEYRLPPTLTSLLNEDLPVLMSTLRALPKLTTLCDSNLKLTLFDICDLSTSVPNLTHLQCRQMIESPPLLMLMTKFEFRSLKRLACLEASDLKIVERFCVSTTLERLKLAETWWTLSESMCSFGATNSGDSTDGGASITHLELTGLNYNRNAMPTQIRSSMWSAIHTLTIWSAWEEVDFSVGVATLSSTLTNLTIHSGASATKVVQPCLWRLPQLPSLTSLTVCHYDLPLYSEIDNNNNPNNNDEYKENEKKKKKSDISNKLPSLLFHHEDISYLYLACPLLTFLSLSRFSSDLSLASLLHLPYLVHLTLRDMKFAWGVQDIRAIHTHPCMRQISVSPTLHRQVSDLPDSGWSLLGSRIALVPFVF